MARIVVSAAAAVVGFYFGGPQGAQLAFAATYAASAGLDPKQRVQGPRLDDLKAPQASYGSPIPYVEGAPRVPGIFAWASEKREIETTEEVGGKGGGGGAESTTYTYEIDVLYLLTINQIAGVRRIWLNGELVWSIASDASEATLSASATTDKWRDIRVYTGASDQLPDPTYEAAVGVGNAPAYRGRGSVFIEGLQLGGSGQLPILTFEVVTDADDAYPPVERWSVDVDTNGSDLAGVPGSIPYAEVGEDLYYLSLNGDISAGQITEDDDADLIEPVIVAPSFSGLADIGNQGAAHYGASDVPALIAVGTANSEGSTDVGVVDGVAVYYHNPTAQGINRRRYVILGDNAYFANAFTGDKKVFRFNTTGGSVQASSDAFLDYAGGLAANDTTVYVEVTGVVYPLDATTLASSGASFDLPEPRTNGPSVFCDAAGDLYFMSGTVLYRYSGSAWTTVFAITGPLPDYSNILHTPVYRGGRVYYATTQLVGEIVTTTSYVLGQTLSANGVGLDVVVSRLCLRTGLLTAGDIDVTPLAGKTVRAMAVSQVTPTRTVIENLMRAYFFDAVEAAKLRWPLRGGAAAATIPFEDLGCYSDGEPPEPLQIIRRNDLELPAQITVKYANMLNDYQDGAESSDRLVTDSTAVQVVEIPLGLEPQEAKRVADVMAMDYAVSVLGVGQVNIDNRYAALEATDVVLLTGETGSTYRVRIVKTSDAQGLRTIEAAIDDATIINSEALTDDSYTASTIVRALSRTEAVLIDGPIVRDADNEPGFYAAASPANDERWPGATLRRSLDGVDYSTESAKFTDRAIVGTASTALGDWTGGYVWDELNSVTVDVNGTLSNSTHDAIQADSTINVIAIGAHGRWEYVQFRTAALQSEGVYLLSGLLRGRRGTEAHMGSHEVGDTVVLLRTTGLRRIEHQSTDIGIERTYKAVTFGKSLASATPEAFTDTGVGLMPFSPTSAQVARDTSGNITISWVRRTRLAVRYGGTGGSYTPLGEASESYSIDVYTDATFTTVVRTLTSTSEIVSYSAADQTTDFGGAQATVYLRIYQLSAIVGRGTALEAAA